MKNKQSLKRQFNIALILLYFVSLLITLPLVYHFSSKEVYSTAHKELSLLVDMVRSMRKTISKDIRPELLRQNILHPSTAISSTVFTRYTAGHFKKLQPQYYIKVASDNPLNINNKPLPLEQEMLDYFRQYRAEKKLVREGVINGQKFLVSSSPSISKANCNICHSTPESAPKEIVEQYGRKSGYGYKTGEVVGASFVGVPLDDIQSIAIKRGVTLSVMLTLLFTVVLVVINLLVKQKILNPLSDIAQETKRLSRGALNHPIKASTKDEIGELALAIELLRRSLKKMLEKSYGRSNGN